MSVVRVHKSANFTVMSNYHFKERKMSLKAKGLLSLMLSLPDDWNYSISGLVTLSKDGKDSVMSALAELEEFGYLVRHRTTNAKGQFSGIEYNIYEQPQREIPTEEKQKADNQQEEKQNAEKPQQLNTKLTNNFNSLPEIIRKDFVISDYILEYEFNEEREENLFNYIRETVKAIESKNTDEDVWRCKDISSDSFFCQNLCSHGEGNCKHFKIWAENNRDKVEYKIQFDELFS